MAAHFGSLVLIFLAKGLQKGGLVLGGSYFSDDRPVRGRSRPYFSDDRPVRGRSRPWWHLFF